MFKEFADMGLHFYVGGLWWVHRMGFNMALLLFPRMDCPSDYFSRKMLHQKLVPAQAKFGGTFYNIEALQDNDDEEKRS